MRLGVRSFAWLGPMALAAPLAIAATASGCLPASLGRATSGSAVEPPEAAQPPPGAAPSEGFLPEPERMTAPKDLYPFDKAWVKPGRDFTRYHELRVAPVTLAYLKPLAADAEANLSPREQREAAIQLALYVDESFIKAIVNDQSGRLEIIDHANPNTIIVEVALTELTPSRVTAGAAASATPILSTPGAAAGLQAAQRESIGMETRLRDGANGEIVGMLSDRRIARAAPLNSTALQKWDFANEIVDDWAEEIVAVIEARPGEKVKGGSTFRLKAR